MKKIVAVDMDDTICHLVKRAIFHHNNKYPEYPLTYEQIVTWDVSQGIWHPSTTSKEIFGIPGLYEELELLDEFVVEELKKIHDQHTLWIVTAAHPTYILEKWNWLQRYTPYVPTENFWPIKQKNKLPFDLIIDDAPHNLMPAIERGKRAIGIRHPWNKEIQDKVFMVDGWKDMSTIVNEMLEEEDRRCSA